MKKAVFLDRDGTIIEDRGYIASLDDVVFYNNTFEALSRLQDHYALFIVTNQSGIAKGLISTSDVKAVNRHIRETLHDQKIRITDMYVCPHERKDGCPCIKPNPYFLRKAAAKYNIDLRRSFCIGDHPCDIELAENTGGRGIYVLTGHGSKHVDELPEGVEIVCNIKQATERILSAG